MSIYSYERVKELSEEQLYKDLTQSDRIEPIDADLTLTNGEFQRLWYVYQISEHHNDFFKHWQFYLSDDVSEKVIFEDDELKQMYCEPYDFDIEECLEEAKERRLIKGFFELSDDLWIINDRGE